MTDVYRFYGDPIGPRPRPTAWSGIENRERLRRPSAFRLMDEAVIFTDKRGTIDDLNLAAERLTGWLREEACGRPIRQVFRLVDGVTREPRRNPVEIFIRDGRSIGLRSDTRLIQVNRVEVAIEYYAAPANDWRGQLTGAIVVFREPITQPAN